MLKTIEGDCDTAVGGLATINNNLITLKSELFSLDGKQNLLLKHRANLTKLEKLESR